jgi:hypothetical protein
MAEQVLALHPDCRYFHMGGDEVQLDAGCKRCSPRAGAIGVSGLLVDHYRRHAEWLRSQGPDPIIWGDMILGHPEHLNDLRGKVIVMDWDYWSRSKPADLPLVWGVAAAKRGSPQTWPRLHRRLFQKYIFPEGQRKARPFPYAPFLRDRGFQVILASAARASGDSFCVPASHRVDNITAAARSAAGENILGSVITSWALRRSPWPLTELSLIAGGAAMADPGAPTSRARRQFAREHFGVPDPSLARIPRLLGAEAPDLIRAMPAMDPATGAWFGRGYEARVRRTGARPAGQLKQLARLARNVTQAERLLSKAKPKTARQRERVALWTWAAAVLGCFAQHRRLLLAGAADRDPAAAKACRRDARKLARQTRALLRRIYTDRTVEGEVQTRFGTVLDHLEETS